MKLVIAQRMQDCRDDVNADYVLNPEWMYAPYELVDLDGVHVTVGPYRFHYKDISQALQYAWEQNLDGLKKLSVPELIPPLIKKRNGEGEE